MLNNQDSVPSNVLRLGIAFIAIVLPIFFLIKGIFGAFLFTFSIPLLWQVGLLRKSVASLGVSRRFLWPSIISGFIIGGIFGLLGGEMLRLFGLTGCTLTDMHALKYSIGSFNINFSLQKEVSYRLLTISNTFPGAIFYFTFCIAIIGLGEELFWRGFIQEKIAKRLSKNIAIWLAAVLYASAHCYIFEIIPVKIGIIFLSLVAIVGAFWGYLFKHFNNIWGPAVSHGITAFIIWKYYFFTGGV